MIFIFYSTLADVAVDIPLLEGAGGGITPCIVLKEFSVFDLIPPVLSAEKIKNV
jgi:hypothetical protein